ncbi:MAG: hypothetical protein IJA72_01385 [Clostridia bacterium]|nr:hypothetical protein [Clostridia bacterium]
MDIYVHGTDQMKFKSVDLFEKTASLSVAPTEIMNSAVFTLNPEESEALKRIWRIIKTYESHAHYSESNAKLCDEWQHDFNSFAEWSASNGFKIGAKIRRINKKEYYSPANCCWVS